MWRVNDTITFGNISVVSNFGSAFHVPSGQTLDGNFGFAKRLVLSLFFTMDLISWQLLRWIPLHDLPKFHRSNVWGWRDRIARNCILSSASSAFHDVISAPPNQHDS